jgi:hypothetical protein
VDVKPIEYEAECPFDYNNFIYKVHVDCHGSYQQDLQPGTTSLPLSTSHLIMRLSNAASGLPNHNRVENEVGMMLLFRQALTNHDLGYLIPHVYAWGSAEGNQGWIMQEFKQGSQLDTVFGTASDQLKQSVWIQMANIVYAMQTFRVPQTVNEFGGVSFSSAGEIISGPMTTLSEGPFHAHAQLYQAFFKQQLTWSDKSPILRGWQEDGIRARLDQFCDQSLPGMTAALQDPTKTIVHSDLSQL